jgi:uncharacterized protein
MKALSEIFIYPVKSLGGISIPEAEITDRGLKYDRRWMLADENDSFLTQRKHPQMALINCELKIENLEFIYKTKKCSFSIGLSEATGKEFEVIVWDDKVNAKRVSIHADEWFSDILGIKCSLVYMTDDSLRPVDKRFAHNNEITSLSDGYPFLIIGQASLDDLNMRLDQKLSINRFRPNFVFTGGKPFEEDEMKSFLIGDVKFYGIKQCSRCVIITINQDTSEKNEEPLRTLSTYRTINNKVMFGMNLLHEEKGIVRVGDNIDVVDYR